MASDGNCPILPPKHAALRMTGLIPLLLLLLATALSAMGAVSGEEGSDDGLQYPGQPGAVAATEAGFVGTYTAGTLPDEGAVVSEFSVAGVTVFASIELTGWQKVEAEVEGSSVEVRGTTGQMELADSPAAYMSVQVEDGQTLTVLPAEGTSIVLGAAGSARVSNGPFSGLLWSDCGAAALSVSQGSARLGPTDGGCKLRFRADTEQHPLGPAALDGALASGQLAAEVTVEGEDSYTTTHVESFEPVEVQVHATQGRVVVAVSGTAAGPRSIVILLPDRVLPPGEPLEATVDGQPLDEADPGVALMATNTTNASFARVASPGLAALVLSLPSFSIHIFELRSAGALLPQPANGQPISLGEAALPIALGTLVAAGAGAALLRRPADDE